MSNVGSLQNYNQSSSLPKWSIALIATLGSLLFLATLLALWLSLCLLRRKKSQNASLVTLHENSNDPEASERGVSEPLQAVLAAASQKRLRDSLPPEERALLDDQRDSAASPTSLHNSSSAGAENAISHTEAAAMAVAFRDVLRKPSFSRNEESDHSGQSTATGFTTPGLGNLQESTPGSVAARTSVLEPRAEEAQKLMQEQLASEGQSVQVVE